MKDFIRLILYQPLYNALIFFVWLTPGNNVGVAIIALTVLVRLALVPSSNKSFQAQKELRELQPKLDEIKKKYSKEEQAQKTMELYKEHKVSPFGSCLPMLVQLPIIFVLYKVFQVGLDTSHFQMLYSFMPRPETVNTMFLGINLALPNKFIMPLIVSALQLLQMWQMQRYTGPTKKSDDKSMDMANMMTKQMMYFTPVMMFIISLNLPAALPLYWGITTLFTIGQQWWFFRDMKPALALANPVEGKKAIESETPRIEKAEKRNVKKVVKSKKGDVVVTVRRKGE